MGNGDALLQLTFQRREGQNDEKTLHVAIACVCAPLWDTAFASESFGG